MFFNYLKSLSFDYITWKKSFVSISSIFYASLQKNLLLRLIFQLLITWTRFAEKTFVLEKTHSLDKKGTLSEIQKEDENHNFGNVYGERLNSILYNILLSYNFLKYFCSLIP